MKNCNDIEKNTPTKSIFLARRIVYIVLAAIILVSAIVYSNFFSENNSTVEVERTYRLVVSSKDETATGLLTFSIGNSNRIIIPSSGSGSEEDPYIIDTFEGFYEVPIRSKGQSVVFTGTVKGNCEYSVLGDDKFTFSVYLVNGKSQTAVYNSINGTNLILKPEDNGQQGNKVGFVCYDATLDYAVDEGTLTISQLRGKIVIINFWYTGCGPCVKELPFFEEVSSAFEDVELVVIHRPHITDDLKTFFVEKGWADWNAHFVIDSSSSSNGYYYEQLGGKGTFPRTLILDGDGIIRYVIESSTTKEKLTEMIETLVVEMGEESK